MSEPKILVVWSNYYQDLAERHLSACKESLQRSNYSYDIETVEAGTYELPAVIQFYEQNKAYEGYLPLGLLLKGSTDHYEFIFEHLKACFIQFALKGIVIGNGIISALNKDILIDRIEKKERVEEACKALNYLIHLKNKFRNNSQQPL